MGDLAITGPDMLVGSLRVEMRNQFGVKVSDANEEVYLGTEIAKFADDNEGIACTKSIGRR